MKADGSLIFRYDNIAHHPELSSFPSHKHYKNKIVDSSIVDLKQVVEEIIDYILD